MYILEMENISKSFDGVQALSSVSLSVKKGEIHALMGENGAGKSTLMKILLGVFQPESGTIKLDGKEVKFSKTLEAINSGIAMVYQELNSVNNLSAAENIFLGKEKIKKSFGIKFVDLEKMRSDAAEIFKKLDFQIDTEIRMGELTVAKKQLVEIAKAITTNPKIMILDEPTSALSDIEVEKLFKTLRLLKERGMTIIYISHKLEEIYEICENVTALCDGEFVGNGSLLDIDMDTLISMMVGRKVNRIFPKTKTKKGSVMLEVENLSDKDAIKNISFSVKKGEILGISGLLGSGRTELAETIFGFRKKTSGSLKINGKTVEIKNTFEAIKNKIFMIPEDRKEEGLILHLSVRDNIILSKLKKCVSRFFISKTKVFSACDELIKTLGIKVSSIDNPASSLSGGNQQKVVIAKALFSDPEIIILDEPTRGIDIKTKFEIYARMSKLAEEGKSVIFISSEMPEILGVSDRIIVMKSGRISGELTCEEATQEKILGLAF